LSVRATRTPLHQDWQRRDNTRGTARRPGLYSQTERPRNHFLCRPGFSARPSPRTPSRSRPVLLTNSFSPCLSHLCACLNLRTRCLSYLCRCLSGLCACLKRLSRCLKQVCACLREVCGCMKRLCTCMKHFCTCMKHQCGCMERVCACMKGRCGCLNHCFACDWRRIREIRPVFARLRAFRLKIGQEQSRRASQYTAASPRTARSSDLRSERAAESACHPPPRSPVNPSTAFMRA
jgi:hypothetical protein